jgi:hypothetical protein
MIQKMLDLGVEIEKCVDAHTKLALDLFAGAFQHMHGDVGFVAVGEFERGILYLGDFALGQQPQTVNECEISHAQFYRSGVECIGYLTAATSAIRFLGFGGR